MTDRHYHPADELHLPYNHPDIGNDWETQHKSAPDARPAY
jgi:dTDP-4-dehydrorhamnose 3,5-epimerase-like enzyme